LVLVLCLLIFLIFPLFFEYNFTLSDVFIFVKNRVFAAMFVGFFAFLFNHSVIIIWPGHTFIILGFCLFLLGFMRYIKFLKTDKPFLLFSIIPIFLIGMWCYESFFLWPLAIIIISSIKSLRGESNLTRKKVVRRNWLVFRYSISCLFFILFIFYISTYIKIRTFIYILINIFLNGSSNKKAKTTRRKR